MPEIDNDANNTLEVTITPSISVYWSQERCWHGDKVKIILRTAFLPDDTVVDLVIAVKDGDAFDISKGHKIKSSKVDFDYTVDWKEKPPPPGKVEFVVTASTTKEPVIKATSKTSLFVDLAPPVFSY